MLRVLINLFVFASPQSLKCLNALHIYIINKNRTNDHKDGCKLVGSKEDNLRIVVEVLLEFAYQEKKEESSGEGFDVTVLALSLLINVVEHSSRLRRALALTRTAPLPLFPLFLSLSLSQTHTHTQRERERERERDTQTHTHFHMRHCLTPHFLICHNTGIEESKKTNQRNGEAEEEEEGQTVMAHLVRLFLVKCEAQQLLKAQSKDDNNDEEEEEEDEAEVKMEDSVVCGYLGLLVGLLVQPNSNNNSMDSDDEEDEDDEDDEGGSDRSSSSSVKKMKKLARWMLTKMPSGRFAEITRALRLFLAFQWHAAGGDLLPAAANKDAEDGPNQHHHHHPHEPTSSSTCRARRRPPPVLALYGKAALAATTRLVRALERADSNQCL